jgi:hypothetical protein
VNGGHLRRKHCLELVLWLDAFDDGQHEIKSSLVDPFILRIRIRQIRQLLEKAPPEIVIGGAERLHQERGTDNLVRMIRREHLRLPFLEHLQPCRRWLSSLSGGVLGEHGLLAQGRLVLRF